jgi:hypothetical protein
MPWNNNDVITYVGLTCIVVCYKELRIVDDIRR